MSSHLNSFDRACSVGVGSGVYSLESLELELFLWGSENTLSFSTNELVMLDLCLSHPHILLTLESLPHLSVSFVFILQSLSSILSVRVGNEPVDGSRRSIGSSVGERLFGKSNTLSLDHTEGNSSVMVFSKLPVLGSSCSFFGALPVQFNEVPGVWLLGNSPFAVVPVLSHYKMKMSKIRKEFHKFQRYNWLSS